MTFWERGAEEATRATTGHDTVTQGNIGYDGRVHGKEEIYHIFAQ